jgi:hypothetical protein
MPSLNHFRLIDPDHPENIHTLTSYKRNGFESRFGSSTVHQLNHLDSKLDGGIRQLNQANQSTMRQSTMRQSTMRFGNALDGSNIGSYLVPQPFLVIEHLLLPDPFQKADRHGLAIKVSGIAEDMNF